MKRLAVSIAILVFLVLNTSKVWAEDVIKISPSETPTPTSVKYDLPYPGLLPGNPLYVVKKLRDRIIEVFLTDPEKKSDFYLLQADKNLATGIALSDLGRTSDAQTTISKGENYLEQSLAKAIQAKRQQEEVSELSGRMDLSVLKYEEIIRGLLPKTKGDLHSGFENNLERAQNIEKNIRVFRSGK